MELNHIVFAMMKRKTVADALTKECEPRFYCIVLVFVGSSPVSFPVRSAKTLPVITIVVKVIHYNLLSNQHLIELKERVSRCLES